jgi:hypothetical protein
VKSLLLYSPGKRLCISTKLLPIESERSIVSVEKIETEYLFKEKTQGVNWHKESFAAAFVGI